MTSTQINVIRSEGDADTDIAKAALLSAKRGHVTTVYCDDTDVLALLLFHRDDTMADIFFWSEVKGKRTSNSHGVFAFVVF